VAISVHKARARACLERAVAQAESNDPLPERWTAWTKEIGAAPSRTFTAALGTALLAKATDSRIDPLALKATEDPRAYSARTLGHQVLVPASVEFGFDLGATGREPLNNQPFFRYDRIDEMARVHAGARGAHHRLVECLSEVDQLTSSQALDALAAFLRVRTAVAESKAAVDLRAVSLSVTRLMDATEVFIAEDPEGGRRGQALVAGVFDVVYGTVRMGRVNDPSRRFPGDVQILAGTRVLLAAEVRQKPVTLEEVLQFASSVRTAGGGNAVMVALHPDQQPLDRTAVLERAEREHGVLMSVIDSADELIASALMWSEQPINDVLSAIPQAVADRLHEIEVTPAGIRRWRELLDAHAASGEAHGDN
jgi:hypothetical protein